MSDERLAQLETAVLNLQYGVRGLSISYMELIGRLGDVEHSLGQLIEEWNALTEGVEEAEAPAAEEEKSGTESGS
jgi:hypothetical protein